MKNWEFLLQKEGDRSWLPLDSPDVEILEGRYRIVARSTQLDTDVEIRISHVAIDEVPPKRRVQKRAGRTNQDGLMVIIPFTWLKPGRWELRCSLADLMSDLLGAKPYTVQLQVLAQDVEVDEWESDWAASSADDQLPDELVIAARAPEAAAPPETAPSETVLKETAAEVIKTSAANEAVASAFAESAPTQVADEPAENLITPSPVPTASQALPPEIAQILTASMEQFFDVADQLSNQLVDEVLQDLDFETEFSIEPVVSQPAEVGPPATATETVAPSLTATSALANHSTSAAPSPNFVDAAALALTLDQELLIAARGDTLTLTGQIATTAANQGHVNSTTVNPVSTNTNGEAVAAADPWGFDDESTIDLSQVVAQELQLYLRDPQSLQVLVSDRRSLAGQLLPFSFSFSFTLPADVQTHLVLGEVLVCGALPAPEGRLVTLTTEAFTITVDPKELVGELTRLNAALETDAVEDEEVDLPVELAKIVAEQEGPALNLSFLDLEEAADAPLELPRKFASLAGQALPPQIYNPDPAQARQRSLSLPTLPTINMPAANSGASDETAAGDLGESQPPAESSIELEALTSNSAPVSTAISKTADSASGSPVEMASNLISGPAAETEEIISTDEPATDGEQQEQILESPAAEIDLTEAANAHAATAAKVSLIDLPSPTIMSFQALRLQDRFLTRLNSLATDTELTALLKAKLPAETSSKAPLAAPTLEETSASEAVIAAQPTSLDSASPTLSEAELSDMSTSPLSVTTRQKPRTLSEAELLEREVVVADDPIPLKQRQQHENGANKIIKAATDAATSQPSVLAEDEPVPTPILEVTTGELVAGKLVHVRVKLPNLLSRIYVKLWVIDRETRSLLDSPRWLIDFLPNGFGFLEATTPLTVPFGSLEVRFEAIAVEIQTQRESHKVTVDRAVVPPNLPVLSLSDFDA